MTEILFGNTDRVSEEVVAAYEIEQARWRQNRARPNAGRTTLSTRLAGAA